MYQIFTLNFSLTEMFISCTRTELQRSESEHRVGSRQPGSRISVCTNRFSLYSVSKARARRATLMAWLS